MTKTYNQIREAERMLLRDIMLSTIAVIAIFAVLVWLL